MDADLRTTAAGYPTVLRVHDEIVAEVQIGAQAKTDLPFDPPILCDATLEHFTYLMKQVPEWAAGCPINCESWKGTRYRK